MIRKKVAGVNPFFLLSLFKSGQMTFPENLHRLRTQKGLSQVQLSEATGGRVSSSWVAKAEGGKVVSPRLETLQLIAMALAVTVEDLVAVEPVERSELRYSLPPGVKLPSWKKKLLDDMVRNIIKQIVESPDGTEKVP